MLQGEGSYRTYIHHNLKPVDFPPAWCLNHSEQLPKMHNQLHLSFCRTKKNHSTGWNAFCQDRCSVDRMYMIVSRECMKCKSSSAIEWLWCSQRSCLTPPPTIITISAFVISFLLYTFRIFKIPIILYMISPIKALLSIIAAIVLVTYLNYVQISQQEPITADL